MSIHLLQQTGLANDGALRLNVTSRVSRLLF